MSSKFGTPVLYQGTTVFDGVEVAGKVLSTQTGSSTTTVDAQGYAGVITTASGTYLVNQVVAFDVTNTLVKADSIIILTNQGQANLASFLTLWVSDIVEGVGFTINTANVGGSIMGGFNFQVGWMLV